jgi:M6 family metalloprotease-like protein
MTHTSSRHLLGLGCVFAGWCLFAAAQDLKPALSDYRTVNQAITTRVSRTPPGQTGQTGYLGVSVQRDGLGRLVVEEVQPESPADRAGVKRGDLVTRVGEQVVKTPEAFREWLKTRIPGEAVKLGLLRADRPVDVTATLVATSRPMKIGTQRVFFGAELGEALEGEGVRVERVAPDSPAAAAGLKSGEHILKLEGADFTRAGRLTDILTEKRPGDMLTFVVRRDGQEITLKATLVADRGDAGGRGARGGRGGPTGPGGRGGRGGPGGDGPPTDIWKKPVFRVAVVAIEFPDVKHNAKVPAQEWEEAFFSRRGSEQKTNTTGQPVHGSLNEYYQEQSYGALRLEGKVFDWVEVGKKRGDYIQGSGTSNKTAVLVEALDKVTARDGKDAFKDFDGFLFLYAGERVSTNRGAVYYPHAGSVSYQMKRVPYLLGAEGGSRMAPLSAFVKEFGRVLGLPDLAARPENPGSEGLGVWCAMSNPLEGSRPQHFCAWAKEKLGWVKPTILDPTVKQKLILSPIEDSSKECFKVLVRPDGSEYFLLENRRKQGFDAELPGEGLLIWRVVNDRPILEESHGVEGPAGPTVHLSAVPYPSSAGSAFTPNTTPSSRSPLGGGLPVHITDIHRLPDGRITFRIGYEYH